MSPVSAYALALPVSATEAFDWHAREGAFERLSPPWRPVRVLERRGGIEDGARVLLDAGFPVGRWSVEHFGFERGRAFRDRQVGGPFARWEHVHAFSPEPGHAGRSSLEDRIEWELPFAPFSNLAHGYVRRELDALFAWRHRVTALDLAERAARPSAPGVVAVTGSSGMIGTALVAYLRTQGVGVRRLVRREVRGADEIAWDPARGILDPRALEGLAAVIHLAGAGIADAPWTDARKRTLVDSRVAGTRTLARALAQARGACPVWVSASAVGIYGDRGEEALDESSALGSGFLAELGRAWESAAEPAAAAGVRVVHPRIGIVLWPQGGALEQLLRPFRFGVGGPLGSGRQWWSWVTLHDLLSMLLFAVSTPALAGPFNAVAPEPVRMRGLARAIGRTLGRPAFAPAPAFALRALLGREMADAILLSSQRLRPSVLERHGYRHRDPALEPALCALLGRVRSAA